MKQLFFIAFAAMAMTACTSAKAEQEKSEQEDAPVVYFTKEITPESLIRVYEALGVEIPEGARVAVKISTGTFGNQIGRAHV